MAPAVFAVFVLVTLARISAAPADEPAAAAGSADVPAAGAAGGDEPAEPTTATAQAASDTSGTDLLTQVRGKLEGLDSLQCELHQTATFGGMKLLATGRYAEATGNRVRLEFQINPLERTTTADGKAPDFAAEPAVRPADESRGILTQVSDGSILYTAWKNGDMVRVTRRNIRDILAVALTVADYDPQHAAMDLGIGGLRGLIARLQSTMDFAPPKTVTIGEREFFEVTGRWNDSVRKNILGLQDGAVAIPQPQIPEYVRLYIETETLLPRRIQYLKRSPEATPKNVRPMLTLDLRNMKLNESVADELFIWQSPENAVEDDQTELVINAIRQANQPAPESPAAPAPQDAAPAAEQTKP